jgi:hypothetical protein
MDDTWKHFVPHLPKEIWLLDLPVQTVRLGFYGEGWKSIYVPSAEEIEKPDLLKLFRFMKCDHKHAVLLSRPLIRKQHRRVFRQFGTMHIEHFNPAKKRENHVVLQWFAGSYEGIPRGRNRQREVPCLKGTREKMFLFLTSGTFFLIPTLSRP